MKYRVRESSILHDPDILPFTKRYEETVKQEVAASKSGCLSVQIVDESIEAMRLLINAIRTKYPLTADLMALGAVFGAYSARRKGGTTLREFVEWIPKEKEVWE